MPVDHFQEALDNEPDQPQEISCNRCGADGCYWQETWDARGQLRPKLFEDGKPHVCKPDASDFEAFE